jgi:CelD/BcsL family acetyltransferase involved in cellulose biosynthesis
MPFLRVAHLAGDPIAQFSEILVDPALATRSALDVALKSVKAAGADVIVFRRVRDDSHLLDLARPYFRGPSDAQVAPFADISGYADHTAFLQSLSKKTRRALKHRQNHLDRAGKSTFETLSGGREARAALADAIALKRKWLVQHGALSSAFVDPATRECLLDLAGSAAAGSVVLRLLVNGEPAAFRFGFEHGGTHFSYLSAYDERFSDASPGKLLMDYCIAGMRGRGLHRIDMLPPAGRHKTDWCPDETAVADYSLPLTGVGRLYADLYQAHIRPALYRTWHGLPTSVRSRISALFVRL